MELNIFERQLQLMLMLAQNRQQTKVAICRLLGISTRTFYRYLDAFRRMGFVVEKSGEYYRLDKSSPFFQKISSQVQFTDSEAVLLGNVLDSVADGSPEIVHLKNKLLQLYDNSILQLHQADPVFAENLHQLYRAVRYRRVAVLKDYRSLRSDSVSDRLVEPFQFLGQNEDVRCYEHSSGQCKTFKVERIGRVVMLDDVCWSHEDDHRTLHTDLFHFSDGPSNSCSKNTPQQPHNCRPTATIGSSAPRYAVGREWGASSWGCPEPSKWSIAPNF